MSSVLRQLLLIAVFLALMPVGSAYGDTATIFTRVAVDEDLQPRALQMSIVTYAPLDLEQILSVDLISAIHIGDPSYYAELNERFRDYDVLLYELVAPQDAVAANRLEKRKGILSSAQLGKWISISS